MGIDGIQGNKPDPVQVERQSAQSGRAKAQSSDRLSESQDQVELSGHMQEFLRIRKLVDAVPDVRKERVERLRQKIGLGTYHVPASDIADAILRSPAFDLTEL